MKTESDYVLLWSQSQCALHIEAVGDMLRSNHSAFVDDRCMDYVSLFFGTHDECSHSADSIRHVMKSRQEARAVALEAIDNARIL